MTTMPGTQIPNDVQPRLLTLFTRRRAWIYLLLLLLAVQLIVIDQRAARSRATQLASAGNTRSTPATAPAPAPPDDRPLLLPDR